jgi:hypothetical protein
MPLRTKMGLDVSFKTYRTGFCWFCSRLLSRSVVSWLRCQEQRVAQRSSGSGPRRVVWIIAPSNVEPNALQRSDVSSRYAKQLTEDVQFRQEWTEKVGLGFDLSEVFDPGRDLLALRALQIKSDTVAA